MKPTLLVTGPSVILGDIIKEDNTTTDNIEQIKQKQQNIESLYQNYVHSRLGLFNPETEKRKFAEDFV